MVFGAAAVVGQSKDPASRGSAPAKKVLSRSPLNLHRYTAYDTRTSKAGKWEGVILLRDPRKQSSLGSLRLSDGGSVPWYRHPDGSHGWPVLASDGQLAGLLNVRADQTLALALSAKRDGVVNILIQGNLRDGGTHYLFDEQGASILRNWMEGRSTLCLEKPNVSRVLRGTKASIVGCDSGRASGNRADLGPGVGGSRDWGGITDPLDLVCEGVGGRPGWSPPTYAHTPQPLTPEEQEAEDKERQALRDVIREGLQDSRPLETVKPPPLPSQRDLEAQIDKIPPDEKPGKVPQGSLERDLERLRPVEPPPNPYEKGHPGDPEIAPSENLIRFCEYRRSNRLSLRAQLLEVIKPKCVNPAAMKVEKQCFGRELEPFDMAEELRDDRCAEGDAQRHCEPSTIIDRLRNLRTIQAYGALAAVEICNTLVCRRPE